MTSRSVLTSTGGIRRRRVRVLGGSALLVTLALVGVAQQGSSPPPGAEHEGQAFRFEKIQDDVYHAVGTSNLTVGCNSAIIINQDDVLIVDSHISPAAAWTLQDELKAITSKPIRYLVNTHFHFDHAHGNQEFPPGVEIIGHAFTRRQIASGGSMRGRAYEGFVGTIPEQLADLEDEIESTQDPGERATLQRRLMLLARHKTATDAVTPVPPSITMDRAVTLYRGGREIRLLFLGRGHTGGDVVVYLPNERLVVTGDLLTEGTAYLGDAFVPDWVETLDRLGALDFEVVLPGHGNAFRGKEKIGHFQAYLKDFWSQVERQHAAGVEPLEAALAIDLRAHQVHYPAIREIGAPADGVFRAYELLGAPAP